MYVMEGMGGRDPVMKRGEKERNKEGNRTEKRTEENTCVWEV